MDCDAHMDDDEDGASIRSSSSLSSSDWEEVEGIDEPIPGLIREPGSEADDEQSDWPGPESGSVYGGFTGIFFSSLYHTFLVHLPLCVIFTILVSFSQDNELFASKAKINVF